MGLMQIRCAGKVSQEQPLSFGLISDCQYHSVKGKGMRKYSMSDIKLSEAVAHFNQMRLDFVIHLGDFIDKDFESFDIVSPIFAQLSAPHYHVLGNHDFSVTDDNKSKVSKKLGMPARYYDFAAKGWRFLVLDGNDISFHAYPEDSQAYKRTADYYEVNEIKSPRWNGALGDEQLFWLGSTLEDAEITGEKVVMFCHFPIYPENDHNLWNAQVVLRLIEKFSCVKAYINGHNHAGNYDVHNGIHYLTIKGMVDTRQTSYTVITLEKDGLQHFGSGREQNRTMKIR